MPSLFYRLAARRGRRRDRDRTRLSFRQRAPARRWPIGSPRSHSGSADLPGVYLLSQICVIVAYLGGVPARQPDGRRTPCGACHLADGRRSRRSPYRARISARRSCRCRSGRSRCCISGARSGSTSDRYWYALAVDLGLLLLTTYMGLILVGLLLVFAAVIRPRHRAASHHASLDRGRDRGLRCLFPHLVWIDQASGVAWPTTVAGAARCRDRPEISIPGCGCSAFFWSAMPG